MNIHLILEQHGTPYALTVIQQLAEQFKIERKQVIFCPENQPHSLTGCSLLENPDALVSQLITLSDAEKKKIIKLEQDLSNVGQFKPLTHQRNYYCSTYEAGLYFPIDSFLSFEYMDSNPLTYETSFPSLSRFVDEENIVFLRNYYMAQNILNIARLFPDSEIIVVVGALHSSIYYDLIAKDQRLIEHTTVYDSLADNESICSMAMLMKLRQSFIDFCQADLFNSSLPATYYSLKTYSYVRNYKAGVQKKDNYDYQTYYANYKKYESQISQLKRAFEETIRIKERSHQRLTQADISNARLLTPIARETVVPVGFHLCAR